MQVFLYNIFLLLFRVGVLITSLFDPKAKKWVQGRKGVFEKLEKTIPANEKIIWVHCASLGEFEQGRPIMERLRKQGTRHKILLTFFSPSGYEAQKNYKGADWVFYLPMDGPRNARRFLEIVHPSLVIFVKYEFWFYYLKKIKYRNIPLLLISALFRKDMSFFKWYGGIQRKILGRFDHLFVQNSSSKELLDKIGLAAITSVSGDTRFDRVTAITKKFEPLPVIEQFIGNDKVIVAGSTWKEDEELLKHIWGFLHDNKIKLIIAPHEITDKHLASIKEFFPGSIRFSELKTKNPEPGTQNCLIVDNIGMLSRLYNYAWCCYVGGGLSRSGIHNVLEAAAYRKPVLFGPYYKKYQEAIGLVAAKGSYSIENGDELMALLKQFIMNEAFYRETAAHAGEFVKNNTGAVEKIMNYIQEKRLLTS